MTPPTARRVLCVEDDDDTCFMLTYLLATPGREVVSAPTLAQARASMAEGRFDLYVLDMRLRDGGGVEFCREVLRDDPWAKVVFYTGAGGGGS